MSQYRLPFAAKFTKKYAAGSFPMDLDDQVHIDSANFVTAIVALSGEYDGITICEREFEEARWFDLDDLPENLLPGARESLTNLNFLKGIFASLGLEFPRQQEPGPAI